MDWLHIIGDGLWIAALSIICSSSLGAWKRIPAKVKVPMQWARSGKVSFRASRPIALLAVPVAAFVAGMVMLIVNRNAPADGPDALILFGVRATVPAILAIVHLRWLQAALKTLEDEGEIER
ncbi:MAG: hypothetical protein JWP35_218 [Caulobacter sp.]|nr:hypothetical protein [Caulobacter sp.]